MFRSITNTRSGAYPSTAGPRSLIARTSVIAIPGWTLPRPGWTPTVVLGLDHIPTHTCWARRNTFPHRCNHSHCVQDVDMRFVRVAVVRAGWPLTKPGATSIGSTHSRAAQRIGLLAIL